MSLGSTLSPARWLSTTESVDRASYIATGVVLMAAKYALETGIVFATYQKVWPLRVFLSPLASDRVHALGGAADGHSLVVLAVLGALSLPFLAIGLSMSVRRAADADWSPWLGLGFAVPGLNYFTMLALAIAPSRPRRQTLEPRLFSLKPATAAAAVVTGVLAATGLGVGVVFAASDQFGLYGSTIFFVLPVAMGAVAGYAANRDRDRGVELTLQAALAATLVSGGALLLFALEGIVCVMMAAPIAALAACIGAQIGRVIALVLLGGPGGPGPSVAGPTLACLVLLPALASVERSVASTTVYEVSSSVEIAASPDAVWTRVVAFPDLPPAREWYFRSGIAVPLRARIEGEGVSATRYCEFSTGAFVEPITAWEPGHRLAFAVASQPPPMREWSPYGDLNPPHLDAALRSVRGEFRLVALEDGRTRLEGSTWYTLALGPEPYFRLWSDAVIHRIHLRVLEHVRELAERDARDH